MRDTSLAKLVREDLLEHILKGALQPGDRIAQLVVLPIARVGLQVVDTFTDSARGTGGFGHTGVR